MALLAICFFVSGPAAAAAPPLLIPPVDAPISRPFQGPVGPYGPGHRGVDYALPVGTRIRAAAAGTVAFAGPVAGSLAVAIAHGGGVRTTYSILSRVLVHAGMQVEQGQWIGLSGIAHPGQPPGLHFGVKVDGNYVDPAGLLVPTDITKALHLAPLAWRPVPQVARLLALPQTAGDHRLPCATPAALGASLPPPDRNIAVALAGFASKTVGGASSGLYSYGPRLLGYDRKRTYLFSYRGIHGPHLHRPYRAADTYGDLRHAARKLRALLVVIHRRFPRAGVDLFAHSQGGLVARLLLESAAASFDPRLPRVGHLVTFSTPNEGAPLAAGARALDRSGPGHSLLGLARGWAQAGGPLPDPLSPAVRELAPGSDLLDGLARQDVAYGTQVLTLTTPFDVVVPADRAGIPGKTQRVVPPNGLFAHSSILRSASARRIEYSFLRGGPLACKTWWDAHGGQIGAGIDWAESHLGGLLGAALGGIFGLHRP